MFKTVLKQKKMTQEKLANQIGVSQQLVSFWCVGKMEPSIKHLKLISQVLKVDMETLVNCFVEEVA